jgi:hypothetical protein
VRLIGRFLATNTASSWASPTQVSLQPFVTPRRIAINANASTTSLTNAYATVVYPTKIGSDPLNAYDASTGTFTCPVAAWYRVSAGISFGPKLWGADHKVGITIAKNGTAIFEGFGSTSGITDVNAVTKAANCSWNIECAVGDTITIQGKQTQTSSGNALDGSIANFICIEKIAGD